MRKSRAFIEILIFILSIVLLSGCLEDNTGQKSELQQINTPNWSEEDLEAYKILTENPDEHLRTIERTQIIELPFYDGPLPMVSKMVVKPMYAGMSLIITQDFEGFTNYFVYNNVTLKISGTAEGAVTIDDANQVIAEARFLRYIKGKGIVEIEEFHYGPDGELIFKCKSQISFAGVKVNQTEDIGKKERDYYFFYPATM
ncbi:MAG: hypothetical protein WBC40_11250 [Halobacteriota archaeon]